MKITLAQAKSSRIPQAVGLAACDPRFLELLNDAQFRLANLPGRWYGTVGTITMNVTDGQITWPRDVLAVEAIKVANYGLPIRNGWYEFQADVLAPNVGDEYERGEQIQLLDRGMVMQFRDMPSTGRIKLYSSSADNGTQILLQGLDGNGDVVRTQHEGEWIEGELLTLSSPSVTSSTLFKSPTLTAVQKPVTKAVVNVWSINPDTLVETNIATWQPNEANPEYRRSYILNLPSECGAMQVSAKVRLRFIPAVLDTDWLHISNLEALQCAMRSIQKRERNLYKEADAEMESAIRSLRNQLAAYSPTNQTTITSLAHGTARPSAIFGGFQ